MFDSAEVDESGDVRASSVGAAELTSAVREQIETSRVAARAGVSEQTGAGVDEAGADGERGADLIGLVRGLAELVAVAEACSARVVVELDRARRQQEAERGVPARRRGAGVATEVGPARRESAHRGRDPERDQQSDPVLHLHSARHRVVTTTPSGHRYPSTSPALPGVVSLPGPEQQASTPATLTATPSRMLADPSSEMPITTHRRVRADSRTGPDSPGGQDSPGEAVLADLLVRIAA